MSDDPHAPINEAEGHIKMILLKVLKLEKDRLHQARPRTQDEILDIIKDAVDRRGALSGSEVNGGDAS